MKISFDKDKAYIVTTQGDPEGGGDYYQAFVILGGKPVTVYGDDYHDKGEEKAEGFIDGYIHATENPLIIERKEVFVGEDNYMLSSLQELLEYEEIKYEDI